MTPTSPATKGVTEEMVGAFFAELKKRNAPLPFTEDAKAAIEAALASLSLPPPGEGEATGEYEAVEAAINEARRLNHAGVEAAAAIPSVIRAYLAALSPVAPELAAKERLYALASRIDADGTASQIGSADEILEIAGLLASSQQGEKA